MIYKRILNKVDRSFFLFGPRGVGKSTWLKQSYPDSTYVDLLDEGLYQSLLADPSLFYKSLNALSKGSKVIVDEIQRLPHLLNEVHRIIEDRKFQFILSGSSSRKLKKVGTKSREAMEIFLSKKVFLSLFVKVIPDWRNKKNYLKGFGYES